MLSLKTYSLFCFRNQVIFYFYFCNAVCMTESIHLKELCTKAFQRQHQHEIVLLLALYLHIYKRTIKRTENLDFSYITSYQCWYHTISSMSTEACDHAPSIIQGDVMGNYESAWTIRRGSTILFGISLSFKAALMLSTELKAQAIWF